MTLESLARMKGEFREGLVGAGLLIPAGVDGLYARGAGFELVLDAVDDAITRAGDDARALTPGGAGYEYFRFPPVFSRHTYEKTDYIESFPDLTGVVNTFGGTGSDHRQLLSDRAEGRSWDHHLSPGDTVMVSSACHPLYGAIPSALPAGGIAADVSGFCFRHEPSTDPMRMQMFRMHEFVRAGSPEDAARFRAAWVDRAVDLLTGLGLEVRPVAANDPFFGRAGKLLANEQLNNDLKTEIVTHVYGNTHPPDAIASCNLAEDHFGKNFDLTLPDGSTAHTACVGFGLERITLALFAEHGYDHEEWPTGVQRTLFR
ncbi:amino acid--[acyl-carrier-protein] ligase [Dietzia kunjamensis]|uniref:amino acid--[acyl-carrier-protein] ligase n=1 Tax=Dietzia kunjamensis TaxID=322509 RepID=UPI0020977FF2|nr:amino acid--[acyl-carrier-protein] ligase [Dietzia kunjamensis]USX47384.1 amino acid--[acyl-carrier-protein] ligase [Dietzia kunjamensis]